MKSSLVSYLLISSQWRVFSICLQSPNTMLEAYLAGLWNPNDERAVPSPSEKDRTQSIIDELQRKLDFENSIIAEHQRRARLLLLRDSKQLETLIISLPNTGLAMQTHDYMRETLDIYPGSLRRFRLYVTLYSRFDSVETFKSGLRDVAKYFASRGRDIEFELIRGQDRNFF